MGMLQNNFCTRVFTIWEFYAILFIKIIKEMIRLFNKRIVSGACALLMAFSVASGLPEGIFVSDTYSITAQALENDFNYSYNEDGTVMLRRYIGSSTDITIPAYINGNKVSEVEYCILENVKDSVKSLTIEADLRTVGSEFSSLPELEELTLPDSIETITSTAFSHCPKLRTVTIPEGVKEISSGAFSYSGLEEVSIPDTVTCIDSGAFSECTSLSKVNIDADSIEIGSNVFKNTPYMAELPSQNGMKFIGSTLVDGHDCKGDVVIPEGTTLVAYGAFNLNNDITSVSFPSSLTAIDNDAFYMCSGLKEVNIPGNVKRVGDYAFNYAGIEKLTIGNGTEELGARAFAFCRLLEDVTLPDSLTSMQKDTFEDTPWIDTVPSENGFKIFNGILYDATDATGDVTVPDGVRYISYIAFYKSKGITSLTIPEGITSFSLWFDTEPPLKTLDLPHSLEKLSLSYVPDDLVIKCYPDCLAYEEIGYSNHDRELKGVTTAGDFAYFEKADGTLTLYDYTGESKDVSVPEKIDGKTVTALGDFFLSFVPDIESVYVPNSVTQFGEQCIGYYKGNFNGSLRVYCNNHSPVKKYAYAQSFLADRTYFVDLDNIDRAPYLDEPAINITGKLSDAAFDYLQEIYIDKYPELGRRQLFGTEKDDEALKKLGDRITKNCKSETEKALAVQKWIQNNIDYDVNASAFPSDTIYTRKGNCYSIALLMQSILRLQGITAVVGEGWRADMTKFTQGEICSMDTGHAWLYAYIDGKWGMFDPLWLDDYLTQEKDSDYIANYFYVNTIEGINVSYDGLDPYYIGNGNARLYIDGHFFEYDDGDPSVTGSTNLTINNTEWLIKHNGSAYDKHDGIYYTGETRSLEDMAFGEIYTNGYLTYDNMDFMKANENGILTIDRVIDYDGHKCFADPDLLCLDGIDNYWVSYGLITVPFDYTGPIPVPLWIKEKIYPYSDSRKVIWETEDTDIIEIDENGSIISSHATDEHNLAHITVKVVSEDGSGLYADETIALYFSKEDRTELDTRDTCVINGEAVPVDVELKSASETLKAESVSVEVDGKSVSYSEGNVSTEELEDGEHKLTFSAPNFVPRTYTVEVKDGQLTEDFTPELHLIGDTTGDGKLNSADLLTAKSHIKGVSELEGYDLDCANVDGKSGLTSADLLKMKAHIKGVNKLWES